MIGSYGGVIGGLTGGVGGIVSGAIGGLGSLMGIGRRKEKKAREAEEREHQRQLEYMGLQAQYNKEQAKYSTELSKEMWDYTNYENQKKHLEEAGLNPALLYGSSGGGALKKILTLLRLFRLDSLSTLNLCLLRVFLYDLGRLLVW